MSWRGGLLLVFALLIVASASGSWNQTIARQATPATASPTALDEGTVTSTLLRETVDTLPPTPVIVGLARWTFEPGAQDEFAVPGPELYIVETGTIILLGGGSSGTTPGVGSTPSPSVGTPTPSRVLQAGDQAVIPANAEHALRNDGDEPATVINVVIYPASLAIPSWLPDPETPAGVRIENLAADMLGEPTDLPAGPAVITLDRTTVTPGTSQPLPRDIAYGLVVAESGALELTGESSSGAESRIGPREVARFNADSPTLLRNSGDDLAVALVLTISAGERIGATPAAGTPVSG